MECNAARSLLDRLADLGAVERASLDSHLEACDDCAAALRGREKFDARLGAAMLAVPLPAGLKGRVLDALLDDGRKALDFRRRVVGFAKWAGSAAAAMLVAVGGWYAVATPAKPEIHPGEELVHVVLRGHDRDDITAEIRKLGVGATAPAFVNYQHLFGSPSLAILPSTLDTPTPLKVPQLTFAKGGEKAIVYVVPRKLCNLDQVTNHEGYPLRLAVVDEPEVSRDVYIILYTGKDWKWLEAVADVSKMS